MRSRRSGAPTGGLLLERRFGATELPAQFDADPIRARLRQVGDVVCGGRAGVDRERLVGIEDVAHAAVDVNLPAGIAELRVGKPVRSDVDARLGGWVGDRSEERSGGTEWVRTSSTRGPPWN